MQIFQKQVLGAIGLDVSDEMLDPSKHQISRPAKSGERSLSCRFIAGDDKGTHHIVHRISLKVVKKFGSRIRLGDFRSINGRFQVNFPELSVNWLNLDP